MGELVDGFAGKIDGELIRSRDWNGLIAAIEGEFAGVAARIEALEPRLAAIDARCAGIEQQLAPLIALGDAIRQRQRRIDLSATQTRFAIGDRGEIVARITDVLGNPLNLSDAATRPWIDFVTIWGSLKAVAGFASTGGSSNRSVSVQVNAQGEARVLLRAEHSGAFAEDQEVEMAGVLQTSIGRRTVAETILAAATPGDVELVPAFAAVARAYERKDTPVIRNYLDTFYLQNPTHSFKGETIFKLTWRDYHAVVLAFVKPDDSSVSADGAQAVGSIRVTFRDWINPWIVTDYLPPLQPQIDRYRDRMTPQIGPRFDDAVRGVFDIVREDTLERGVIGIQRELLAAQKALETLTPVNPPSYLKNLVDTVRGGLTVQQGMAFSQAFAPLVSQDIAPALAVGAAGAQGTIAADRAVTLLRAENAVSIGNAEGRILAGVKAETSRFSNDLLREDGPIRRAESLALAAQDEVKVATRLLGQKASIDTVSQLLTARRP